MTEINKDLKRELKKEMEEIKGIERKAKAFDILMKYFDISCAINNIRELPYRMKLCVQTHDEYAPASDLAVALVDLDNENAQKDYRFLIILFNNLSIEQSKIYNPEVDNINILLAEDTGMTKEEDNIDTKPTGINNPDGDYNVYGSKLEDVREINRLKDENLELKLIIGEMQHKIFKLHKELDEKD